MSGTYCKYHCYRAHDENKRHQAHKHQWQMCMTGEGNDENTWLGSGHALVANRMEPYEIRNAPNVKASLMRKYHIMSFPYSTLKGLLPPVHHL